VRAGRPTLWRRAHTDGSYLSASDARVHVGLGERSAIDRIVVEWPDGAREAFAGIDADRIVTITRGAGHPASDPEPR
jgi:enediyne biosynthesis protein E4